jgi:hypothetical protein
MQLSGAKALDSGMIADRTCTSDGTNTLMVLPLVLSHRTINHMDNKWFRGIHNYELDIK